MSDAELIKRVEKLERDNRRLKRGGLVALVLLAVLVTIYAAQPVPQTITAHEFDVTDGAGRVRASMNVGSFGSQLTLYNGQGTPRVSLSADSPFGPALTLMDAQRNPRAVLHVNSSGPGLVLRDAQGSREVILNVDSSGPTVVVSDAKGYEMDLGSTVAPATGETQQTSAASIIMLVIRKGHHVIWQAP